MTRMMDVGARIAAELGSEPCPHCGGQTRLEESARFRWVCAVCGGPRIPVKDERAHSQREKESLRRSNLAAKRAFGWRVAASGLGLTGALVAGLGTIFAGNHVVVGVVILAVALALIIAAMQFAGNARKELTNAKLATFEAWGMVGEALLRLHGGQLSAKEIAALMQTTEGDAERMMTVLTTDSRVRVDLGDDAELRYRVTSVESGESDAPGIVAQLEDGGIAKGSA